MNSNVKYIIDEKRIRPKKSEVQRLCCDNTKLCTLTNYTPKINIREGLKRTIDWFTEPANLKKYKADIYNV